jgi:uncharacterized protein YndB with AHSA1/START domain
MTTLKCAIDIDAPKKTVWTVMLEDATYRQWTSAFHEGSHYIGSWDKGSEIQFVAADDDGLSGMASKVVENIPYQYISLENLGTIDRGKLDTESDSARQWIGSREDYYFTEENGRTHLQIEMRGNNITAETSVMMEKMWRAALQKLKQIAEALSIA